MDVLIKKIKRLDNSEIERYIDLSMDLMRLKIENGIIDFDLKERYDLGIKEMERRNINIIPYQRRFDNLMRIYKEVQYVA